MGGGMIGADGTRVGRGIGMEGGIDTLVEGN